MKGKRQNQLTPEHIERIIGTYKNRTEAAGYAKRVTMTEIAEKNDYNLNISRYVSTATIAEEIDLDVVHQQLVQATADIEIVKNKHNAFLRELGLALIP